VVLVPTTLEDVARGAGVSMKTVSRVVNNEPNVAQETRRQVLRVIADMGYVPHLQAQRVAPGRTRSNALHYPLAYPALISNDIELNFSTGIALGAAEQDYFFSLMTGELTHAGLLRLCRGAQADGLVLMQVALNDWAARRPTGVASACGHALHKCRDKGDRDVFVNFVEDFVTRHARERAGRVAPTRVEVRRAVAGAQGRRRWPDR
jgi:Bacterial regulatory proteins, lacI family